MDLAAKRILVAAWLYHTIPGYGKPSLRHESLGLPHAGEKCRNRQLIPFNQEQPKLVSMHQMYLPLSWWRDASDRHAAVGAARTGLAVGPAHPACGRRILGAQTGLVGSPSPLLLVCS